MSGRRRARPTARVPARVPATAILAAAVLAALTLAVATGSPLLAVDDAVARAVAAHRPPPLVGAASVLTWLGSAPVLVPLTAVVAATARARTGSWRPGAALALAGTGAWASMAAMKELLARPRPDGGLVAAGGYAFPSGHSAAAAAWWVTAALVLAAWPGPRRRWPVAAGATVAAVVGVTRVVLGVHRATDVVAGWSLGALWVVVVAVLLGLGRPSPPSRPAGVHRRPPS